MLTMLVLQPELASRKTPIDLGAIAKDVSAMGSSSEIVEPRADEMYFWKRVD
jgi:hypothetical protein